MTGKKMETTMEKNFTTPEQSKRLLEIKLLQNTADMYYQWSKRKDRWETTPDLLERPYFEEEKEYPLQPILPCWSAGRLIELSFLKRDMPSVSLSNYSGEGLVEMIVQYFEVFAKNVDWSQLHNNE